jgi:hypothetical protein
LGEVRGQLQMDLLRQQERDILAGLRSGAIPQSVGQKLLEKNQGSQIAQRANQLAGAQLAQGGPQGARGLQVQQLGVDLSQQFNILKHQSQLTAKAQRQVLQRNLIEVGGVWVDEAFTPQTKTQVVKAFSPAYFRILERHPEMKEVFKLGAYVVWITPTNQALVIDANHGAENLTDAEIDALIGKPGVGG